MCLFSTFNAGVQVNIYCCPLLQIAITGVTDKHIVPTATQQHKDKDTKKAARTRKTMRPEEIRSCFTFNDSHVCSQGG